MSKDFDKARAQKHKESALSDLERFIDSLIHKGSKKAELLSYWLEDYVKYLSFEPHFNPKSLRRYKRGEVIKAHLGYNIGSEEGGLHYCVVIEKDNPLTSPIINVIPLTSVKDHKNTQVLRRGEVFLGSDLRNRMQEKLSSLQTALMTELHDVFEYLDSSSEDKVNENLRKLDSIAEKNTIIQNISQELQRMKNGSIALVGQITTLSKIRIYEPKTNKDALSNIRLSNESLTKIDAEMKNLFIHS